MIVSDNRLRLVVLAMLALATPLSGADKVNWLTGAALRKRLDEPVDVGWSGQSLRDAVNNLSRAQQVVVLIDRRIDPGQTLVFSRQRMPLRSLLDDLASTRELGTSMFEPVVYIGPPTTARLLRTVAELRKDEVAKLPQAKRLEWIRVRPWRWDDLAEPRELLAEVAKQGGFEIEGLERVPHDLWPAVDLPPLSMADRLTLVLAQFELTFEPDTTGRSIKLTPFPGTAWLERTYPGGKQPQELAEQLAQRVPGIKTRVEAGRLVVQGLLEDHERIDAGPTKPPKPPVSQEKNLDTIKVTFTVMNVPLKTVLESLREQLGLIVQVDTEGLKRAGKSLDGLVSLKLKDASVDDTLKAALSPAGLSFKRTDKIVQISVEP